MYSLKLLLNGMCCSRNDKECMIKCDKVTLDAAAAAAALRMTEGSRRRKGNSEAL